MRTNAGAIPAQTVSLPFVFVWFWVWFRCAFCEGLGFEFEFVFFPGSGCTSDARNLFNLVHPIEKRALRILENWVVCQAVTCLCRRQCPKVVSLTSVLFVLGDASLGKPLQLVSWHECGSALLERMACAPPHESSVSQVVNKSEHCFAM